MTLSTRRISNSPSQGYSQTTKKSVEGVVANNNEQPESEPGEAGGAGAGENGISAAQIALQGMEDVLGSLPPDASPEQIQAALEAAGMDDTAKDKVLKAFTLGGGVLHSKDGTAKFLRPEDMAERMASGLDEFDAAIAAHKAKDPVAIPQLSSESRALMKQILESNSSQDEISSRVAALLAGTALSTSRGGDSAVADRFGNIETQQYDIQNEDLSSARKHRDNFEMPDIPAPSSIPSMAELNQLPVPGQTSVLAGGRVRRTSVKRQSEIMREARKSRQEEREEDRKRKESYFRRVSGLRKAKVPLMVYNCGGFSRCFRIARFYDQEGPPVGVVYERPEDEADSRAALNPDL